MTETEGHNRYYHCDMLLKDIAKRDKRGDTRAAVYIDDSEAAILTELLQAELCAIRTKEPQAAEYWDKHAGR